MKNCLKILLLAALTLAGTHMKADEYTALTIAETDGETSYALSIIDKITFDDSDMVLHLADGTEQRLPLANLQRMFFSNETQGIVAKGSPTRSSFTIEGGRLTVKVARGERFTLYNLKGEQVATADHDTTVDLKAMPRGVYIVKLGQQSGKFLVQ